MKNEPWPPRITTHIGIKVEQTQKFIHGLKLELKKSVQDKNNDIFTDTKSTMPVTKYLHTYKVPERKRQTEKRDTIRGSEVEKYNHLIHT